MHIFEEDFEDRLMYGGLPSPAYSRVLRVLSVSDVRSDDLCILAAMQIARDENHSKCDLLEHRGFKS